MTRKTAHVVIGLDDVVRHGGVRQAIAAWCEESDSTACGIIGPSFSTSGPGPGWSIQHDRQDYAARALSNGEYGGALYYLDADSGRLAQLEGDEDDEDREIAWTDESVVCLDLPSLSDALECLTEVAEMAAAVRDHHSAESDTDKWDRLAVISDAKSDADALIEALDVWHLGGDYDASYTAHWREDSEQRVWDLPTYILRVGQRVVMWTDTDEARAADIVVRDAEDDLASQVREYAEEISEGLGELVDSDD